MTAAAAAAASAASTALLLLPAAGAGRRGAAVVAFFFGGSGSCVAAFPVGSDVALTLLGVAVATLVGSGGGASVVTALVVGGFGGVQ